MIGILEAVKYATSLDQNKILILTDCKSAVQKLTKNCLNTNPSHIHLEILQLYLKIPCNKEIKIAWVKGHEGVRSNQEVDSLAKYAAEHSSYKKYLICPSDLKCYLEKEEDNYLYQLLDTTNKKGLFYKNLFTTITKKPWFNKIKLNRKFIVTFNRLRVNHAICPDYLRKINIQQNNICDECQERETIQHQIMICKKNQLPRKTFLKKIEKRIVHPFN